MKEECNDMECQKGFHFRSLGEKPKSKIDTGNKNGDTIKDGYANKGDEEVKEPQAEVSEVKKETYPPHQDQTHILDRMEKIILTLHENQVKQQEQIERIQQKRESVFNHPEWFMRYITIKN